MELKEFISNTLVQLVEGIADAQDKANKVGALINPAGLQAPKVGTTMTHNGERLEEVEFDLALTVDEGKGNKGRISIHSAAVNIGTAEQSESRNTAVNHVRFRVAVLFPPGGDYTEMVSHRYKLTNRLKHGKAV